MAFTGLFLQELALTDDILSSGFLGLILGFLAVFLVIIFLVYVYLSFAYFAIAKKARLSTPGLSWIPFVGPLIVAYQTSNMHWWPWLLVIGFFIPFIGFVFSLAFTVFSVVWHWKMFETIGKPGWWSILMLIPIVGFILIGIAAWGKK
ncbi:MAG: hypothetical protein AABX96_05335 [Nanoarchaeota archaeon]